MRVFSMRNTAMISPPLGGLKKCLFSGKIRLLRRPDSPINNRYKSFELLCKKNMGCLILYSFRTKGTLLNIISKTKIIGHNE